MRFVETDECRVSKRNVPTSLIYGDRLERREHKPAQEILQLHGTTFGHNADIVVTISLPKSSKIISIAKEMWLRKMEFESSALNVSSNQTPVRWGK